MTHVKPLAQGLVRSRCSMHLAMMIIIVNYHERLRLCLLGTYRKAKATKQRIEIMGYYIHFLAGGHGYFS